MCALRLERDDTADHAYAIAVQVERYTNLMHIEYTPNV